MEAVTTNPMKEIAVTRKIKDRLSAHFDAKGTINIGTRPRSRADVRAPVVL